MGDAGNHSIQHGSKKTVALIALGCPKNDVDSEIMLGLLQDDGYTIVTDVAAADAIIVNTCAFIKSAQEEAIEAILAASRQKNEGVLQKLLVTGCLAERYQQGIIDQMPEVDAVIGTGHIGETAAILNSLFAQENAERCYAGALSGTQYLENRRVLSETRPFQYLKIAEGCDNHCTYCIIPSLRGPYRSRPIKNLIKEAEALVSAGAKEIVLVAQDVTRYGMDFSGEHQLVPLIQALSEIQLLERIRLLYCYPEEVDAALIAELQNNPKLARYLDLPIQHISDPILKRMGRKGNAEEIKALLLRLRTAVPGIVLRTTYITGFPGETEENFETLLNFVAEAPFEHTGVFDYSKEHGTPAGKMKNQVAVRVRKKRRDTLLAMQQKNVENWHTSRLDQSAVALIEGVSDDGLFYVGRTEAEAPDIDPVVYIASEQPLTIGQMQKIKFLCMQEYDMMAMAIF